MFYEIKGLMNCVVGTDQEIGSGFGQFVGRGKHQLRNAGPVSRVNALHVLSQGVRVQRHLRMIVAAQHSGAFQRDGAVAEGCSFSAAGDYADMKHQLVLSTQACFCDASA